MARFKNRMHKLTKKRKCKDADASSTTTGNILEFNVNNHNNSDAHIESKMASAWYPGKLSDITANADVRLKKYCRQYDIGKRDTAIQEELLHLPILEMLQQVNNSVPCKIFEILDPSNPVKKAANPGNHVYGVKATENIQAGRAVCEYSGKIMTTEEYQQECGSIEWIDKQPSRLYAFDVLKGQLIVDASPAIGNYGPAGRINDGPGPYKDTTRPANVKYIESIVRHRLRILVVATRDISKGEEILASYGKDFWAGWQTVERENRSINEKINSVYKHCENEIKNLKYLLQQHMNEKNNLRNQLLLKEQENLKLHATLSKTNVVDDNNHDNALNYNTTNNISNRNMMFKPISADIEHRESGGSSIGGLSLSMAQKKVQSRKQKRSKQVKQIILYAAKRAEVNGTTLKHLVRESPELKNIACKIASTNIIQREKLIQNAIEKITQLLIGKKSKLQLLINASSSTRHKEDGNKSTTSKTGTNLSYEL